MRGRIIAYGVAVLLVLAGVSLVSFWAIGPSTARAPHEHEALARRLVDADAGTRAQLLDEARAESLEVSIYSAEGALIVANVEPAVPLPPDGDVAPRVGEGAGGHPPAGFPLAEPARQRPELFAFAGIRVVMRAADPRAPLLRLAIPLAATTIGLVLLSFPATAAMTRRLEALAGAAHRFGEGDLGQRADASGSDEVSRTARAFNAMAARIGELRLRERELLANVSHELRTPMARMAVALELTEDNPAEMGRYVRELARDLRELESLLDGIIETLRLDLASPRAREHWPVERVDIDLRELVEAIADDFRARAPARPLVLALATRPVVHAVDRTLVRRALLNLLDNAHKYSPAGAEIRVALGERGEIEVADRGGGIAATDLCHVFEPFFRADRSRTRSTGGVGLGLTFVKLVAELHHGAVAVRSEPGVGTTFRLELTTRSDTSRTQA